MTTASLHRRISHTRWAQVWPPTPTPTPPQGRARCTAVGIALGRIPAFPMELMPSASSGPPPPPPPSGPLHSSTLMILQAEIQTGDKNWTAPPGSGASVLSVKSAHCQANSTLQSGRDSGRGPNLQAAGIVTTREHQCSMSILHTAEQISTSNSSEQGLVA
ncbi:uncharacterized protein LOC125522841 isoform X3 [Triticum urartu]|uniref:uncharacterized protein LOC125522841 isoform X3 n=1 Tax=Triticum urartu TaxID=4572 RepID=UPI002043EA60|nr:uncharacterized protein LOC125522841 isoform X3 [Triticum urartu]